MTALVPDLNARVSALETRVNNVMRVGTIAAVQQRPYRVQVDVGVAGYPVTTPRTDTPSGPDTLRPPLRSIESFKTRDNPGQVGCRLSWGQRRTGIGRQNRGARRLIYEILFNGIFQPSRRRRRVDRRF